MSAPYATHALSLRPDRLGLTASMGNNSAERFNIPTSGPVGMEHSRPGKGGVAVPSDGKATTEWGWRSWLTFDEDLQCGVVGTPGAHSVRYHRRQVLETHKLRRHCEQLPMTY